MNIWDQLVDCICRPPRDHYKENELLGGSSQTFMVGNMEATRIDFDLKNKLGQTMKCSHYLPLDVKAKEGRLPVVVYCHCNSGSRRDAEEAVWHLLPCGVGVVAFDFTGSGLSDGKWVTLGAHEVDDLAIVVQHLRSQGGVSSIGLWGRSMGAVTALLYSHMDPNIAGMVLDSPFSRLTDLMLEIVVNQKLPIPRVMLRLALKLMRNSVKRKAGCDINAVSPLDVVGKSLIPAMFGHGEEDSFINIQHSVKLHGAYNASAAYPVYKNLVRFRGDHNHPRPAFFYASVCCFFHQQLDLDGVLLNGNSADTQQLLTQGSLNLTSEPPEQVDRANGFINTPWSLDGMPHVSDMPPEQQQAAAAAATAALQTYSASSSAAAGPVAGSNLQDLLMAGDDGLNSPRIGPEAERLQGGSVVGSAPAGRFDDFMRQQQHEQRRRQLMMTQPIVVPGAGSYHSSRQGLLSNDAFEIGSRGNLEVLGAIPSPMAASAPLGLAGVPFSSSSSSSAAGVVGNNASCIGNGRNAHESTSAAESALDSNGNQNSSKKGPGPLSAASFVAASGQQLKRFLLGRGAADAGSSSSQGSRESSAAAGGDISRSSIDNSALRPHGRDRLGRQAGQQAAQSTAAHELMMPAAAANSNSYSPLQQQQWRLKQQLQLLPPSTTSNGPAAAAGAVSPAEAGIGLAGFGLPASDSSNAAVQPGFHTTGGDAGNAGPCGSSSSSQDLVCSNRAAPERMIEFGVRDNAGTWVGFSIDDESAVDPDLAAAIAASLQDQHLLMGADGAVDDPETQPGELQEQQQQQQEQQQQLGSRFPVSVDQEEEMLRKAIQLSLADVQQQGQVRQDGPGSEALQQQQHQADAHAAP